MSSFTDLIAVSVLDIATEAAFTTTAAYFSAACVTVLGYPVAALALMFALLSFAIC